VDPPGGDEAMIVAAAKGAGDPTYQRFLTDALQA
jgi:hypothetical protein